MGSSRKQHGNIHRIREFELEKVNLSDEFDILQIVGEGWFGKILLVEHRATDTEMVLKALPKPYVSLRDFYREFHYGLHLSAHKNIVTTYDVAFETAGFYVFTQEYAPLGDLTSNVSDIGIGELHTKRVAKQIASALDYIHSKELVHRDVKLDNVLVCRSDFSRVKLCDFGETRKAGSYVQRRNEWLPYSPPEVILVNTDNTYQTIPSHDIWQFGIVLFVCLTGCLPWQKAAPDDPRYVRYLVWQHSSMVIPIKRTPKLFKLLTSRACKLFRKFLEPVPERRPKNMTDLQKYLDDRWLAKNAEKDMIANEPDELCASMYSFHSSPEEKNKLLYALAQHGIETTVDRVAKKKRIRDWIQESIIQEDDEEDLEEAVPPSPVARRRAPIAGHVSSVRAEERAARKAIVSTVKDAAKKHINPRTGEIQQGPSEMGHHSSRKSAHQVDSVNGHSKGDTHDAHNGSCPNGEHSQLRNAKLVDVGSQTSTESQKQREMNNSKSLTPDRAISVDRELKLQRHQSTSAMITPQNPIEQRKQTNIGRSKSTSRGLISAFNSLASITMPESQQNHILQQQEAQRNAEDLQRQKTHKKQPISRSANNSIKNLISDSGYGSLDKLRTENNHIISSPILSKRSVIQSSFVNASTGMDTNQAIHINGLSHGQHDGNSPFHSDSGGDGSPRGSTGFVNLAGLNGSSPLANISMKDTAYDRVKLARRKK